MVHCFASAGARIEDAPGQLNPAPVNLFDSKVVRSGGSRVDVDITGARELCF